MLVTFICGDSAPGTLVRSGPSVPELWLDTPTGATGAGLSRGFGRTERIWGVTFLLKGTRLIAFIRGDLAPGLLVRAVPEPWLGARTGACLVEGFGPTKGGGEVTFLVEGIWGVTILVEGIWGVTILGGGTRERTACPARPVPAAKPRAPVIVKSTLTARAVRLV